MILLKVSLLGDRAHCAGNSSVLQYHRLKQEHNKYADDRWFPVTLINNFILKDISNVYLGICLEQDYPFLFDIWIGSLRLNLIDIT